MNTTYFNPSTKNLVKVKIWKITPHHLRNIKIYHYDNTETAIKCLNCSEEFNYEDLVFNCFKDRNGKIQIRQLDYYGQHLCFNCGIKELVRITPKKLLHKIKQLTIEYNPIRKVR